jgi:hypothetical protein
VFLKVKLVLLPGIVFNGRDLRVNFPERIGLEPVPGLDLALDEVGDF